MYSPSSFIVPIKFYYVELGAFAWSPRLKPKIAPRKIRICATKTLSPLSCIFWPSYCEGSAPSTGCKCLQISCTASISVLLFNWIKPRLSMMLAIRISLIVVSSPTSKWPRTSCRSFSNRFISKTDELFLLGLAPVWESCFVSFP